LRELTRRTRRNDEFAELAEFASNENSIPDGTFTPLVPDSDYHSFSGGFDYTWKSVALHAAYQFNLWEARVVRDSIYGETVNGRWDAHTQVFMAGVQVRF
jgi:long-subunit fatty acid transport protein